jgi:hypothetical protein
MTSFLTPSFVFNCKIYLLTKVILASGYILTIYPLDSSRISFLLLYFLYLLKKPSPPVENAPPVMRYC